MPLYIREISSMKTRGLSITLMMVMTTGGYMMKLAMNLEEMMYLMAALVGIQLILIILIVESPSYSVIKGKFEVSLKVNLEAIGRACCQFVSLFLLLIFNIFLFSC